MAAREAWPAKGGPGPSSSPGGAAAAGTTSARPKLSLSVVLRAAARPRAVVYESAAVWALVFAGLGALNYHYFFQRRFDLGNMTQAVWATAHGHPLQVSEVGGEQIVRLAVHVDPLLGLLAPLWWLWPSPVMLVVVQAIAVAVGAIPVFWLARKHLLSDRAAACLAAAYLLFPQLQWQALNDFHPPTVAVSLLLFAMWYLDEGNLGRFAVFAVLAAASQEQAALLVAGLGIWYAVRRGRRYAGLGIVAGGIAWSAIAFLVVIPHFSGGPTPYASRYAAVGGSPLGIVRTLFEDPLTIVSAATQGPDIVFLALLALPLLGLFVREPLLLAAALPQFALCLLSARPSDVALDGHATSLLIPFLVGATVLGVARLRGPKEPVAAAILLVSAFAALRMGPLSLFAPVLLPAAVAVATVVLAPFRLRVRAALFALVVATVLLFAFDRPSALIQSRAYAEVASARLQAQESAVALIPPDAVVSATNHLGSHLSARRRILSFPLTAGAGWVVVDRRDTLLPSPGVESTPGLSVPAQENASQPTRLENAVQALRADQHWTLVFDEAGVVVFRRAR